MTFSTFIPMAPVAKARARVTSRGSYTPKKTKDAEREIAYQIAQRIRGLKGFPLQGILELQLTFNLLKPKSCPKSRKYPTVRPDLDNYVKLVKDACNGILWTDDAQIVTIFAHKKYNDVEGIYLEVKEIS